MSAYDWCALAVLLFVVVFVFERPRVLWRWWRQRRNTRRLDRLIDPANRARAARYVAQAKEANRCRC